VLRRPLPSRERKEEENFVRNPDRIFASLLTTAAALGLVIGQPSSAAAQSPPAASPVVPRPGAPQSFADLTERLAPAVVNISTRQRVQMPSSSPFAGTPFERFFGGPAGPRTREAQSLGSGFILSADGYIVTNNHVITADGQGKVETIMVTLHNGEEYPATLVGSDPASDLAVLKITSRKQLPFVTFGDSTRVRVGDWVLAIGNPFGLGGTVTAGIVSAVYRNTGTGRAYDRYLQTDASINRGNSGGPMFDSSGRVIGINNAIFSPTGGNVGIGFAIPAEIAAPIVEKLKAGKAIERGYLGVTIQPMTEDLASSLGVPRDRGEFVQSVEPGGPAAQAGIRAGDVILRVDGKEVTPSQSLSYLVASVEPGRKVAVELMRGNQRMTVIATPVLRPSEDKLARQGFGRDDRRFDDFDKDRASPSEKTLGLAVEPLTPSIARQLGASDVSQGLVISSVEGNSDAARRGLSRGDIILSANNRPVASAADLEAAIRQARTAGRSAILLRVKGRGEAPAYVPVRLR
jgi:serine protease Do